jgi:hypothetical protein
MMGALPVRAVVMVHTIMVRPFVPVVTVLTFIDRFHVYSISNLAACGEITAPETSA